MNLSASARFRELTDCYYRAWFRFHPEAAVDVGVPGYERLLTPFAPEDLGALVCLNDQFLVSLDELDARQFTPDEHIDWELVRGAALLENQFLLDLEPRCPDPARALPIHAIYQLTIRPVPDLKAALSARLGLIPAHLRQASDYFDAHAELIPPLWLHSAVTGARAGGEFLRGLAQPGGLQDRPAGFDQLVRHADQALTSFADLLEYRLAGRAAGNFACGRARFEHLLRRRHFLNVNVDQVRQFGEALSKQLRAELGDACQAFIGSRDLAPALAEIRRSHPPAHELLSAYRRCMESARDFVLTHRLVTPPARECLEVIETPMFLRHQIPFAAYAEPSPGDPEQRGYYYVTPPGDDEQLAEHDYAGLAHTCVHEAWPGHHFQFVTANSSAVGCSLPRLLNASATLYEGWALYSEQLMCEQGFLAGPKQRVVLLRDRLWRALRVIIDVGLHTRNLSIEQAVDLMVTELGFPRSQALADITWYTRSPTVPLSYATGWAIITSLRAHVSADGESFDLKGFHDRLLSAGSIGLPKAIERVFGLEHWHAVRDIVFQKGAH